MPMSKPMKESYDRMIAKYSKATRMHDRLIYTVRIIHEEGSEYLLQNAFIDDSDPDYLWVMTEHQGYFIFAKDELCFSAEYEKKSGNDVIYIEE